jgi:hypothetical protein
MDTTMNGTAKEALEYAQSKISGLMDFHDSFSFNAPFYKNDKHIGYTTHSYSKVTSQYSEARRGYNLTLLEIAIRYSHTEIDENQLLSYLDRNECLKRDLPKLIRDYK